jgi:hypothetical protein
MLRPSVFPRTLRSVTWFGMLVCDSAQESEVRKRQFVTHGEAPSGVALRKMCTNAARNGAIVPACYCSVMRAESAIVDACGCGASSVHAVRENLRAILDRRRGLTFAWAKVLTRNTTVTHALMAATSATRALRVAPVTLLCTLPDAHCARRASVVYGDHKDEENEGQGHFGARCSNGGRHFFVR